MTFAELLVLIIRPLGVLTYVAVVTVFTLGVLMTKRKAKLPTHRMAARVAIGLATAHGAAVVIRMML